MTTSCFKEKSLREIRKYLIKFSSGSIDLTKRSDGLAVLLINQESKKNAMSGKMMVDFYDAVEELELWTEGKGVILKGANGNFCSGGDLDFVKKIMTPEQGFMMSTFMQNTLNRFQKLPLVSVALIEGIGALGGGAELTVACDFRLITETCKGIGFVHAKMGILPAWGGTNRLIEKVGYTNALDILCTARILNPSECLKVGLVNEVISDHKNTDDFVISWLGKKTNYDVELMRNIKTSVVNALKKPGDYNLERNIFAPFWGGEKHQEALKKNIKHK